MHQAILVNADINKGTKVSDVSDRAFQNHPQLQVVHGFNAVGKGRGFELRARIAPWFFQFLDDIGDRWHTKTLIGKLASFQAAQLRWIAH